MASSPNAIWTPPADVRDRTEIGRYLRWLLEHRGLDFASYDALWRWSIEDLDGFWGSLTPDEARRIPG